jgi:hypothetical protein
MKARPALQNQPLPSFSRVEMEICDWPVMRGRASDLLQEARSWCSKLQKTDAAPLLKISAVPSRKKQDSPAKIRSHNNVKSEVASLRSDIESVRREIKHLGKKVSKKQVRLIIFLVWKI